MAAHVNPEGANIIQSLNRLSDVVLRTTYCSVL